MQYKCKIIVIDLPDTTFLREKLESNIKETFVAFLFISSESNFSERLLKQLDDFIKFMPETDIFITNSDSVSQNIFKGLRKILYASEKHSCVSPRLRGGGLLNLPLLMTKNLNLSLNNEFEEIHTNLPEYQVIPLADPACVLLKGKVIFKFGFFDHDHKKIRDAFSAWCFYLNRYGYSSVVANQFFLNTDALITDLEKLSCFSYYPYAKKNIDNYLKYMTSPFERFAHEIEEQKGRKFKILLCLHQLAPVYNGTSEHAFAVAKRLLKEFGNEYEFTLLISKENALFFRVEQDFQLIEYPETLSGTYDLGITFIQIYFNSTLSLLNRHCLKIIMTVLDMIVFRSGYLNKDIDPLAFKHAVKYCDGIITISEFTKNDLLAYFPQYAQKLMDKTTTIPISSSQTVIHNSDITKFQRPFSTFILVFGNANEHKLLKNLYKFLPNIKYNFIIVGYKIHNEHKNIKSYNTGNLTNEFIENLYATCSALLFPSDYEGFGLPILHALKYGKSVIISRNEVNRELEKTFDKAGNSFIYFDTMIEIKDIIEKTSFSDRKTLDIPWTYDNTAFETKKFIDKTLKEPINPHCLEQRDEICLNVEYYEKKNRKFIKQYIKDNLIKNYPTIFKILRKIKRIIFKS